MLWLYKVCLLSGGFCVWVCVCVCVRKEFVFFLLSLQHLYLGIVIYAPCLAFAAGKCSS